MAALVHVKDCFISQVGDSSLLAQHTCTRSSTKLGVYVATWPLLDCSVCKQPVLNKKQAVQLAIYRRR